MFGSFSRSWQLVKASWAVLKADKELILFPIISSITLVIVSIIMFIPSAIIAFSLDVAGLGEGGAGILGYIGLFISYFVSYTIIIYFNTGLIGAAMIRLDGGDPTLSDGFRIANERISKILAYAAISATVGVILRIIEERAGFIGDIIASIIGFAWNLATFLVIPVLVSTDMGPIEAVKHSGSLLKKTWGEQITGNFSIGGIFFFVLSVGDCCGRTFSICYWFHDRFCCFSRHSHCSDCGGGFGTSHDTRCAQWYLSSSTLSLCSIRGLRRITSTSKPLKVLLSQNANGVCFKIAC
ncbi:MAG: DUF6159 family protein [Anaerolineae bacterium]|nr:DUF6159 family protein [Anaerolineae bacterium]